MLFELRSEIRNAIESYCNDTDLCFSMLQVLLRPGCALHEEGRCTAGILSLKSFEAVYGTLTIAAIKAAVAVELYAGAAYIFDNLADEEIDSAQGMSPAEELTVAIGLMTCGGMAACEAGRLSGSNTKGQRLLSQLQRDCLSSCSGQLIDARLQRSELISTDESLKIAHRKSGSVGRSAASSGAIMATYDTEIISLFGELGFNLFTYIQLIDDLRDACPADGRMTDIELHKQTLPLTFFYKTMSEEHAEPDCVIISPLYNEQDHQHIRQMFSASGADVFCAIVAEAYLNRAKSNLMTLKGRVRTIEGLEQFVSSMEISPDEAYAAV